MYQQGYKRKHDTEKKIAWSMWDNGSELGNWGAGATGELGEVPETFRARKQIFKSKYKG